MRVTFLAQGNDGETLMVFKFAPDKYLPTKSQTRYPLHLVEFGF